MFAKTFAAVLSALILSGLMSLLVAGISTLRTAGLDSGFVGLWAGAWLTAWPVAFPLVLVVAPLTQRAVTLLVARRP